MSGSEKDVSATRRPPGLLDLKAKAEKIRRNRAICRIRKPAALLLTALLAPDHNYSTLAGLNASDVVIVTKLDRLGRSTRELLDLIDRIGKAGASFRSLGDPLWDTSSAQGRLLSTLLASIAEFERELIRERTGEGRKRAIRRRFQVRADPTLCLAVWRAHKRRCVPREGSLFAPHVV